MVFVLAVRAVRAYLAIQQTGNIVEKLGMGAIGKWIAVPAHKVKPALPVFARLPTVNPLLVRREASNTVGKSATVVAVPSTVATVQPALPAAVN